MRYASVCSGVEAASLAWGKLGWTPVFFAEVEPFPCAVLQQRFNATKPLHPLDPAEATDEKDRKMRESWMKQINKLPDTGTVPNLGDFTKIKGQDYVGAIDLLVGGTPCQDLSVAGKRAGFGDIEKRDEDNAEKTRSSLALDFVRLAYEARCKYFVWENVPGAFSSNGGRDFATLLSWFVGYHIEPPRGGVEEQRTHQEPQTRQIRSRVASAGRAIYQSFRLSVRRTATPSACVPCRMYWRLGTCRLNTT